MVDKTGTRFDPRFSSFQPGPISLHHDLVHWQDLPLALTPTPGGPDVGGAVLLYRSSDLLEWEYLGPLIAGDRRDPSLWTGSVWECPQLLAFGDKHVLVFGVWEDGTHYTVAMTGRMLGHRFVPEHTRKLDAGDRHFYAAQTLTDARGRRLMWGWIQEDGDARHEAGWSGAMSLPRELSLTPDGTLRMKPPEELKGLRDAHTRRSGLILDGTLDLGVQGVQLELRAHLVPNGSACGLGVLRSPDGAEETRVFYDPARNKLGVDRRRSSLDTGSGLSLDVQEGDFELRAGEPRLSAEAGQHGGLCFWGQSRTRDTGHLDAALHLVTGLWFRRSRLIFRKPCG